jgi:hypothetical protein
VSPVAPRRPRSSRTFTLAIGGVVLALGLAVALFVFAIPSITEHNQTTVRLGAAFFEAGSAKDRARDIRSSGPILIPDQSGGQRDIFLQHLGVHDGTGWYAFDARKAGESRRCTLHWNAKARHFDDPCGGPPVPADGGDLVHYRVTVTKDGQVVIDLNPNDESAGTRSGGTTTSTGTSTTTSTVIITGSIPPKG